jgi:hypothetical protein
MLRRWSSLEIERNGELNHQAEDFKWYYTSVHFYKAATETKEIENIWLVGNEMKVHELISVRHKRSFLT